MRLALCAAPWFLGCVDPSSLSDAMPSMTCEWSPVESGITGFVVRTVEEMARAIRPGGPVDRLDRRRIREVAVQRFGRDRMVEGYEQLYGLVAHRRARDLDPSAA